VVVDAGAPPYGLFVTVTGDAGRFSVPGLPTLEGTAAGRRGRPAAGAGRAGAARWERWAFSRRRLPSGGAGSAAAATSAISGPWGR
jgi:hypothetical protein